MFGFQPTAYDKKVYEEQLRDFLPDKMIDAHVHLTEPDTHRTTAEDRKGCVSWPMLVAPDCLMEDLMASYEAMFPGKKVYPMLMGSPTAILDKTNSYAIRQAKKYDLPCMFCTNFDTPVETLRKALTEEGFCGIKPYQNNSPKYIPAAELRIFDFLPKEHLELMNELGGTVMLHISRNGRLKDPVNVAQMVEIDRNYPNAKVIIAHVGRAYSPEDIGDAFEILKNTRNLTFDFTANTLDTAMIECVRAVGPQRMMFGSDMPITKMRMYRVSENGNYVNVIPRGLYGDVSGDPHMRESDETDITIFMYEELMAFKRCAETLHLTRSEIEDIMCNNAARVFNYKVK